MTGGEEEGGGVQLGRSQPEWTVIAEAQAEAKSNPLLVFATRSRRLIFHLHPYSECWEAEDEGNGPKIMPEPDSD